MSFEPLDANILHVYTIYSAYDLSYSFEEYQKIAVLLQCNHEYIIFVNHEYRIHLDQEFLSLNEDLKQFDSFPSLPRNFHNLSLCLFYLFCAVAVV